MFTCVDQVICCVQLAVHVPLREETDVTNPSRTRQPSTDSLDRGHFSDGPRFFTVRASGPVAPDSFQVFANGHHGDIVLIVSGLNTGSLRATWGDDWRTASAAWKVWVKDQAFLAFYNGNDANHATSGQVRFCNG